MSDTFLQNKILFFCENYPLEQFIHLIMKEYDSKCLKMYLITLKVFVKIFGCQSPKSTKGS
jgi:hypothetical protein